MKLLDILSNVGSSVLRNVVPGGGMILDVVNDLLPQDKKLPKEATGDDLQQAIDTLPPDYKAALLEREFDVQLSQQETLRTMLAQDAITPHTTRPKIAYGSFLVVAFTIVITISVFAYAVLTDNSTMVDVLTGGWAFIASVLAPLVTLLWAYFGVLKNEAKDKLNSASGNPLQGGLASLVTSIIKR